VKSAKAFAPGNISCIFVIKRTNNPATSGSLGMGFTVSEGVVAAIKSTPHNKKNSKNIAKINKDKDISRSHVFFNNKPITFPAVNYVINKLAKEPVEVKLSSELPLGCGFGLSGASALAAAYALNGLFALKKSKKELAFIAHKADVASFSGLGDVINQYYGGFLVKYEPSFKFKAVRMPIKNKAVYCKYFSPINKKTIISKNNAKINKAGIKALNKIKQLNKNDLNLSGLIKISKEFSINSGLLKDKNAIKAIKNIEKIKGNASMIMLGNAVFSNKKFKGSKKLMISNKSACLL